MEKKLEVKNLQIAFRTQGGILKAVRDITFDLYKGETLAIVGESGSGKSVTSKAIIGILAGNSIVEGGEILYDGQDLLKITEDDFHKIRGDKIAMIFQDPLSSLNTIMRVGQQLTEAMILKTRTSRRNARHNFNSKLKLLNHHVDQVTGLENPEAIKKNKEVIDTFNNFCIEQTKLERVYNEAMAELIGLQLTIDNLLFLIDKKQKVDLVKEIREILRAIKESTHAYVLVPSEELASIQQTLTSLRKLGKKIPIADVVEVLKKLSKIVNETALKQKPNYFTLGYYVMKNPTADVSSMSINELDEMTNEYLDTNYLNNFKEMAGKGILNALQKSITLKASIIEKAKAYLEYLKSDVLDRKVAYEQGKEISALLNEAINRLSTKKNSTEYSFASALRTSLNTYFRGVVHNPIEQRKFDRANARYQNLVRIGKTPDWKLKPPVLVDLELAQKNICQVVNALIKSLDNDLACGDQCNLPQEVLNLIDFFKDEASKLVSQMTMKMAKAKTLRRSRNS